MKLFYSFNQNLLFDNLISSLLHFVLFIESIKPPGKGQNRKTSPPKVEDVNVNLNRCDTFKDKMEMGSKHLDGGLISKPSVSLNQLCTLI